MRLDTRAVQSLLALDNAYRAAWKVVVMICDKSFGRLGPETLSQAIKEMGMG